MLDNSVPRRLSLRYDELTSDKVVLVPLQNVTCVTLRVKYIVLRGDKKFTEQHPQQLPKDHYRRDR